MRSTSITGLVTCRDRVAWTTLRRRKGEWEVVDRGEAQRPGEAGDAAAGPDGGTAWQGTACAGVHSPVRLALPADRALLRVLDLPSTDPAELRGMVDLQMDKLSPFPVEQLVTSFEILGARDGRTRVLAAALQRDVLDAAVEALAPARLVVREVDLDLLGWWDTLVEAGAQAEPGRAVHVVAGGDTLTLAAVQDGLPITFRAFARPDDPEALRAELDDEVRITLASIETEWGASPAVPRLVFWTGTPGAGLPDGDGPGGLAFERRRLDEGRPLSECIARRASGRPAAGRLDLAPADWAVARGRRSVTRRFWGATLGTAAAWILVLGALGATMAWRKARLESRRAEVEAVEQPAEAARQLLGQVRSLEQYADRTHSALEMLRQVSVALPGGVELTSFTYRKGRQLNLRGDAVNPTTVYDLVTLLEQTDLFPEVKPEGIATRQTPAGPKSDFRINITLPGEAP